jgi:hypothetical protein
MNYKIAYKHTHTHTHTIYIYIYIYIYTYCMINLPNNKNKFPYSIIYKLNLPYVSSMLRDGSNRALFPYLLLQVYKSPSLSIEKKKLAR